MSFNSIYKSAKFSLTIRAMAITLVIMVIVLPITGTIAKAQVYVYRPLIGGIKITARYIFDFTTTERFGTLGFIAYRDTSSGREYGILTAGHLISDTALLTEIYQPTSDDPDNLIAYAFDSYKGDYTDSAFIPIFPDIEVEPKVFWSSSDSSATFLYIVDIESTYFQRVGDPVTKIGVGSGITSGVIIGFENVTDDGVYYEKLIVRYSAYSTGGDSGSPVIGDIYDELPAPHAKAYGVNWGYAYTTAPDGSEVFQYSLYHPIDWVLADNQAALYLYPWGDR